MLRALRVSHVSPALCSRLGLLSLTLLLGACTDKGGSDGDDTAPPGAPYGMPLVEDGQLYAGVARVDLTPDVVETYSDLNGNNEFDGCMTDPTGTRAGCDEPYDDADGDGHFDGIWIAGFQSKRAAMGVHDPITATVVVLAQDGEYVAFVGMDALGVLENRVRDLGDLLEADGFDRSRLVFTSSHSHGAPDTVGIWGIDEDLITGTYPPFMDSLVPGVYDALTTAAADMVPVTPKQGLAWMRDDPTLNGAPFGGVNPDPSVYGGINDIRDPIIPADAVWGLALDGLDGNRVATVVSASGHAEVSDSDHSLLTADYPGAIREYFDNRYGGLTLFMPGSVGGMQSALGSPLPAIDDAGERVLDEHGDPVWIQNGEPGGDWEMVRTWGTLVAQAADGAMTDGQGWDGISVAHEDYLIPVNNVSFKLAFQVHLLDTPDEYVIRDESCPGWEEDPDLFGCVPAGSWLVRLGPNTLATAPGELFPELFYGVPDEAAMTDATARAGDRRWVQWDADCAAVPWSECQDETDEVDGCDCLHDHATPYEIGEVPIMDMLPGTYKQPIGITNAYCGYIVPTPDYNAGVSVLTDDGDHYEETNSCSKDFAGLVQGALLSLTGGA